MHKRMALGAAVLGVLLVTAPAVAAPAQSASGDTITATGTGQTRVVPKNRHSNASIAAAVDAARKASIAGALKEAHEYAVDYAKAVGMTLGSVISRCRTRRRTGSTGQGRSRSVPSGPASTAAPSTNWSDGR